MKTPRFIITNPIFVLILSVFAIFGAFALYLRWYILTQSRFDEILQRFQIEKAGIESPASLSVIIVLAIFLALIIYGLVLIFTFYQKLKGLYQSQENFIDNFTHELKTPIASLGLYLETLNKHQLSSEETEEFYSKMQKDVKRLSDRVNLILQTSRLENKHKDFPLKNVEVAPFLKSCVEQARELYRHGTVELSSCDEKIVCSLNPDLFAILVENLISNGLKYNVSERPKLVIETHATPKTVIFRFCDNGVGVPLEQRRKIFKKFYRYDRPLSHKKRMFRGSGLGLYLVRQIVQLHKGKLKLLESVNDTDGGSVFEIELPRRR